MSTPARRLHCLVVEDSDADALLLLRNLRTAGYDVTWERVETAEAMQAALARQPWDVVLSDYVLPRFSGRAALALLQASGHDLPFIVVSGSIGEDVAVDAMKAGAHDYLMKGNLSRLGPVIERELRDAELRRERRHAQGALLVQGAALAAAADGIVIADRAGTIVWTNPAFTTLTGYSVEEATGKNPRDLVKSGRQDRAFYQQMWATILAGRSWHGELVNRRKDGSLYPEEMTLTPVRAAGGEITHFIAIKRDLTSRSQTDAELQRVNRALRVTTAGNVALLHATDEEQLYEEICRIAVEEGGYRMAWVGLAEHDEAMTVRPVVSKGADDGYLAVARISWADTERGRGPTGTAIRTGRPVICRNMLSDPRLAPWREAARQHGYASSLSIPIRDGDHVFGALSIYATEPEAFDVAEAKWLLDLGGDLSFGVTALRTRRERERVETALRRSEERYRLLFKDNPLAMWLHDLTSFRILDVNASAVRGYGYTQEEFLGMTTWQLCHPDDVPALRLQLEEDRPPNEAGGDLRHRRKDGTIIHVECFSRPVVFDGLQARLVLANDITEKKQLEQQLLHVQRIESIGMLASGIAHDLNNVLAPILFAAPLLRGSLSKRSDLEILDTIETSAGRGAGLVKQVLGFARTSSGEFQPTQVKHLAREIASVMEETFPKSVTIERRLPADLWPVRGNATQLHQVLLNLCVNARDAMPEGGTLRLYTANRRLDAAEAAALPGATPGDWVMLEVADTGSGIPPEVLVNIWTPFFTTKPAGQGTGLGLSSARWIVANHGGFVTVDTQPGRGSTFRVFLPALDAEARQPVGAPSAAIPRCHGELVLAVDDEPGIRRLISQVLELQGCRVLVAADGVEALALFDAHGEEIALVITDVDMPRLGGAALAEALLKVRPDLRLIAMSGLSHDSAEGEGLSDIRKLAGAYLNKPFTPLELAAAVHRLLQPARESRATRR